MHTSNEGDRVGKSLACRTTNITKAVASWMTALKVWLETKLSRIVRPCSRNSACQYVKKHAVRHTSTTLSSQEWSLDLKAAYRNDTYLMYSRSPLRSLDCNNQVRNCKLIRIHYSLLTPLLDCLSARAQLENHSAHLAQKTALLKYSSLGRLLTIGSWLVNGCQLLGTCGLCTEQ